MPELSAETVLGDYRWFAADYLAEKQSFLFVHADRQSLAAQPFLDRRWKKDGLPSAEMPLAALAAKIPAGAPAPDLHFIWHTSYCCSTLIAKALDVPGQVLSLCEPFILVSADAADRAARAQNGTATRVPEIAFRLLARPENPGAKVLVKPSNFANALAGEAARLTSGKSLFLYSSLESFLCSIAKGGTQSAKFTRRLLANTVGDLRNLPWPAMDVFEMSDLEIAALAWHMQIAEFRRVWASFGRGRAASLDCDAFLENPAAVLSRLDGFFGFGLGAQRTAEVANGSLLKQHAKVPGERFDAARRKEEAAAIHRQIRKDLDRIVEWSYRACPTTPAGAPLPDPV